MYESEGKDGLKTDVFIDYHSDGTVPKSELLCYAAWVERLPIQGWWGVGTKTIHFSQLSGSLEL